MRYSCSHIFAVLLALAAFVLAGCQSTIIPLQPVREELVAPAQTGPATMAATSQAATEAATQAGGSKETRTIDPNQTVRYVYHANYDRVWRESLALIEHLGYRLDRQDYRLGVLTTLAQESAQIVEPWRRDQTGIVSALENTVNDQRRSIRLTIKPVADKPEFYEIAVQVLVERETNPVEGIGGPAFVQGSAFGLNAAALRSDYVEVVAQAIQWVKIGHDTALEKKILDSLFSKI